MITSVDKIIDATPKKKGRSKAPKISRENNEYVIVSWYLCLRIKFFDIPNLDIHDYLLKKQFIPAACRCEIKMGS